MLVRLQKLLSQAGVASRRAAEKLIADGRVAINGETVRAMGTKADPAHDDIRVDGRRLRPPQRTRYILVNKPAGYVTTRSDPQRRPTVIDLLPDVREYVYPVGRLDFNSEGLIILTNDGEFTNLVASSKKIPKVYEVKVKGLPPAAAINKLRRGVWLEDGFRTAPAEIRELPSTEKNGWYEVTLYEGHNQQIRKMFDAIGHSVVKLRRTAIGNIRDVQLGPGAYRKLTMEEVKDTINFKALKTRAKERRKPDDLARPARSATRSKTTGRPNKRRGASANGARPSGKGPGRP